MSAVYTAINLDTWTGCHVDQPATARHAQL
jgi:hypothetical protein